MRSIADMSDPTLLAQIALSTGPFRYARNFPQHTKEVEAALAAAWPQRARWGWWRQCTSLTDLIDRARRVAENLVQINATIVSYNNTNYPENLRRVAYPPPLLFVQGMLPDLGSPSVSVVGARAARMDNIRWTEAFCGELAGAGVVVVSGGALGIDAAAHRGVLAEHGKTVAVLGTGLDIDYPTAHRRLFADILRDGAKISPFLPGTPPSKNNFPLRNQIISAFSSVTLVVEASLASGAMNTANISKRLGNPVFVRLGSPGTQALLVNGARLAQSVSDVIGVLGSAQQVALPKPVPPVFCSSDSASIYHLLCDEALPLDSIAGRLSLPLARVAMLLIELEIAGHVHAATSGVYQPIKT